MFSENSSRVIWSPYNFNRTQQHRQQQRNIFRCILINERCVREWAAQAPLFNWFKKGPFLIAAIWSSASIVLFCLTFFSIDISSSIAFRLEIGVLIPLMRKWSVECGFQWANICPFYGKSHQFTQIAGAIIPNSERSKCKQLNGNSSN